METLRHCLAEARLTTSDTRQTQIRWLRNHNTVTHHPLALIRKAKVDNTSHRTSDSDDSLDTDVEVKTTSEDTDTDKESLDKQRKRKHKGPWLTSSKRHRHHRAATLP